MSRYFRVAVLARTALPGALGLPEEHRHSLQGSLAYAYGMRSQLIAAQRPACATRDSKGQLLEPL